MDRDARPPAVAGSFYPGSPSRLKREVERLLAEAGPPPPAVRMSLLISPHAGYRYSGPTAAVGYRALSESTALPTRIGLVGPSHFVPFQGLALPGHAAMSTSLGRVDVDEEAAERLIASGIAIRSELAHRREHSLEVQLPFLQVVLDQFTVVPLLVGDQDMRSVGEAISWMIEEGLFVVISSDLSHYLDNRTAYRTDATTAKAIIELREDGISKEAACGGVGIRAALQVGRKLKWLAQQLDLRTSGDVTGETDRVVGYGAFALGPEAG